MIWNHDWSAPGVRVMSTDRGPVHLPLQECLVCGSRRNAITLQLVLRKRGSTCNRMPAPSFVDHSAAEKRMLEALDALEADGKLVNREYGPKPKADPVQLPLAYKDN